MDIDERFEIAAPTERVWALLRDPYAVAACFPGAELTEDVDDDTYAGTIRVRFGPTTATFSGRATIVVDDATRTGTISARGRDGRGASNAATTAAVAVTSQGDACEVTVKGTIDVTGPLGDFASSGGARVAQVLLQEFGANVARRAASDAGAESIATPDLERARPVSGFKLARVGAWASLRRAAQRMFRRRATSRPTTDGGAPDA